MGYGKTCCVLALIAGTRHLPPKALPEAQSGRLVPSKATLVLAPPNLFGQWQREADKFLGPAGLRVVAIPSARSAAFKKLTVREVQEADLILVSYRLFLEEGYVGFPFPGAPQRRGLGRPQQRRGELSRARARDHLEDFGHQLVLVLEHLAQHVLER